MERWSLDYALDNLRHSYDQWKCVLVEELFQCLHCRPLLVLQDGEEMCGLLQETWGGREGIFEGLKGTCLRQASHRARQA